MRPRRHAAATLAAICVLAAVTASAFAQQAFILPDEIDFGDVAVGDTEMLMFDIRSGPIPPPSIPPLMIESVTLDVNPDGVFSLAVDPPPPFLDQGEILPVEVFFSPVVPGTYNGSVLILSDHIGGQITVPLGGHAIPEPATAALLLLGTTALFIRRRRGAC